MRSLISHLLTWMIHKNKFKFMLLKKISLSILCKKISIDSSIINYVHSLLVIAPGKGEEFEFFESNYVVGVNISNYLDILEIISYSRSDPFTLIDL